MGARMEPDIVWDNGEAVCAVFRHGECYCTHIVFDIFPFDDLAIASEMLSPIATLNDVSDEVEVLFVSDVTEGIEVLTKQTIRVIMELSHYQDAWIFLDPIERLNLYSKIVRDVEGEVSGEK